MFTDFKQKSVEFSTPKINNSKVKIIHKEKLNTCLSGR